MKKVARNKVPGLSMMDKPHCWKMVYLSTNVFYNSCIYVNAMHVVLY